MYSRQNRRGDANGDNLKIPVNYSGIAFDRGFIPDHDALDSEYGINDTQPAMSDYQTSHSVLPADKKRSVDGMIISDILPEEDNEAGKYAEKTDNASANAENSENSVSQNIAVASYRPSQLIGNKKTCEENDACRATPPPYDKSRKQGDGGLLHGVLGLEELIIIGVALLLWNGELNEDIVLFLILLLF